MDQSDIFRLLLVVLLLANSQLSPKNDNERTTDEPFDYTAVNNLLLITMFIKLFASPEVEEETNTTF